jgi:acyl-coenzyme A thioesterase PaaI-like protein
MAASTTTYRMWKRLSERPGGSRLFSAAAMVRVPYFPSIVPHVVRMEPGFAEVTVPKWFFVYNHLHTVHAIASCNAAEIAMGMLMEASVPTTHRWIPKAMNVQYLQKATTGLRAQARLELPDFDSISDGVELMVPVSVVDKSGTEVVHADITCWVAPGLSSSFASFDYPARGIL